MISHEHAAPRGGRPGTRETVALLAGLMALNAFAIDAMIPALPAIGEQMGVATENRRQLVVVAYMLGFGVGQLFWGPLADRFGRKPILAIGVALYAGFALLCGISASFELLIAGRIAMGMSAAVTRVLVVAMVRDLFAGEAMARVMSLVFMVFMLIPVLAPLLGQGILLVGTWRVIFVVLATYGVAMWLWSFARLPETLHSEYRRKLNFRVIGEAARMVAADRLSLGYTLGLTAIFGGLTAYIASIQQIVFDVFAAPGMIGIVFGAVAAPMALASWGNSKLVGRFGLRRVGHAGLVAFVAVTLGHLAVAGTVGESLGLFVALMGLTFAAFAFTTSNLGTLAMTNMAAIAGTASSVQGVAGTVGGSLIGLAIGQSFDGTTTPFLIGLAGCGLIALAIVYWTERGRLFGALQPATT
ncbi:MAG TPA: multidrug effflux MFS transporter [Sphingomicrobium sp.]|nr:multidrug effflux MFS transporter [Sphingomicrobium sp.]